MSKFITDVTVHYFTILDGHLLILQLCQVTSQGLLALPGNGKIIWKLTLILLPKHVHFITSIRKTCAVFNYLHRSLVFNREGLLSGLNCSIIFKLPESIIHISFTIATANTSDKGVKRGSDNHKVLSLHLQGLALLSVCVHSGCWFPQKWTLS